MAAFEAGLCIVVGVHICLSLFLVLLYVSSFHCNLGI